MRVYMKLVLSLIFFFNFVNSFESSSHFSMLKIFKNITYTELIEKSDPPKKMPNLGYVLDGYDIFYGNPLSTGTAGATPDPGFRDGIFNATYHGKVTPDDMYSVPEGMEIKICSGTCAMTFGSTLISGAQKYQSTLEEKASVGFEGWGASFSASVDYKNVETSSKNQSTFFTQSEVSCCAYTASILRYDPPAFTNDFLTGVNSLPKIYEKSAYMNFIKSFGTHYVKEANMGALYGQQSSISSESWGKMVEQGIKIDVSAGYSGAFSVNAKSMTDDERKKAQNFQKECKSQKLYSTGKAPPQDGKPESWMNSVISSPQPLTIKLESLDNLDPLKKYLKSKPEVLTNLKKAMKEYCEDLKSAGAVSSCKKPGQDPPFPKNNCACPRIEVFSPDRSIIGGIFGTYSRKVDKVNDRFFYTSEEHSGAYGIWLCRYENTQIFQWQIGRTQDKGACIGYACNFQDAVCPSSLTGYTWWVYLENRKRWDTALKGIAVRCVSDNDQKIINRPLNFGPTKEVGKSSNDIPLMISSSNTNAPPVFRPRAKYQGPGIARSAFKFSKN